MTQAWLALVIGNTRLHWGFFQAKTLKSVWHTPHLTAEIAEKLIQAGFQKSSWRPLGVTLEQGFLPEQFVELSSLWIASAVPQQAALWQMTAMSKNCSKNIVERSRIPLQSLYPTLGIDRAINLLGAGGTLGWPVLVIDSGTALTFTAGVEHKDIKHKDINNSGVTSAGMDRGAMYGGAILPGLRLQQQALSQQTAALGPAMAKPCPEKMVGVESLIENETNVLEIRDQALPTRWATDTAGAIASGLAYGATATVADYLADWWQQYPDGQAVLTGGDGPLLYQLLKRRTPAIAARVQVDSYLMFWGMRDYRQAIAAL